MPARESSGAPRPSRACSGLCCARPPARGPGRALPGPSTPLRLPAAPTGSFCCPLAGWGHARCSSQDRRAADQRGGSACACNARSRASVGAGWGRRSCRRWRYVRTRPSGAASVAAVPDRVASASVLRSDSLPCACAAGQGRPRLPRGESCQPHGRLCGRRAAAARARAPSHACRPGHCQGGDRRGAWLPCGPRWSVSSSGGEHLKTVRVIGDLTLGGHAGKPHPGSARCGKPPPCDCSFCSALGVPRCLHSQARKRRSGPGRATKSCPRPRRAPKRLLASLVRDPDERQRAAEPGALDVAIVSGSALAKLLRRGSQG